MLEKTTLAAVLLASSLSPAFAEEAENTDYRAVLTASKPDGGVHISVIDGYKSLDSCLLQAKIAASAEFSAASVSCEQFGEVASALSCTWTNCAPVNLNVPTPKR